MVRLFCVLIGYVFGLFQTGYIYGRIKGINIREHGSGNAGTTNALRTLGTKAGVVTFMGDCLKCILAVVAVRLIFSQRYASLMPLLTVYTGLGVVLGHNFPFYLKFRGGKGIASTAGLILTLDPVLSLIAFATFGAAVGITKYVSLGSLLLAAEFLAGVIIYGFSGKWNLSQSQLIEMYIVATVITAMAFFRHRRNIKSLVKGTERKIGEKSSKS